MSLSLREQLIQAGLVSKKQVKQANHQERHQPKHQQSRNKPEPVSEEKLAAQRAQAAKIARDLELNRKQREKAEKKARRAQIKQLVERERVPALLESEEYYNFMDGKRVRRMAVDAPRREQLIRGELVIVRYHGFYAVVPAATARRIRELDEQAIVSADSPPADDQKDPAADEDDPYKDFVVPDDLTW